MHEHQALSFSLESTCICFTSQTHRGEVECRKKSFDLCFLFLFFLIDASQKCYFKYNLVKFVIPVLFIKMDQA